MINSLVDNFDRDVMARSEISMSYSGDGLVSITIRTLNKKGHLLSSQQTLVIDKGNADSDVDPLDLSTLIIQQLYGEMKEILDGKGC